MIPEYDGLPCIRGKGVPYNQGYLRLYGKENTSLANGSYLEHRQACYVANGPPPEGKNCACHTCDNVWCIRASHLFWGSKADNNKDARDKGRHTSGKLTEEDVREILASDLSQRSLARLYGVNQRTIWNIRHKVKWKHVVE